MIPITIEQHFLSISNQTDIKHDIASILYDINLAAKFIRKKSFDYQYLIMNSMAHQMR